MTYSPPGSTTAAGHPTERNHTTMPDYVAKMKAKGLDSTGVTEDLAKQFYSQLGSHHLFIVEARVDRRQEDGDGKHSVELYVTQVEPSTAAFVDDHLREMMRAMYANRARSEDGAIPETVQGADLRDVVRGSGEAVIQRDGSGEPVGIWNGDTDAAGGTCVFPGCVLPYEHDGDHDVFGAPLTAVPDTDS